MGPSMMNLTPNNPGPRITAPSTGVSYEALRDTENVAAHLMTGDGQYTKLCEAIGHSCSAFVCPPACHHEESPQSLLQIHPPPFWHM